MKGRNIELAGAKPKRAYTINPKRSDGKCNHRYDGIPPRCRCGKRMPRLKGVSSL